MPQPRWSQQVVCTGLSPASSALADGSAAPGLLTLAARDPWSGLCCFPASSRMSSHSHANHLQSPGLLALLPPGLGTAWLSAQNAVDPSPPSRFPRLSPSHPSGLMHPSPPLRISLGPGWGSRPSPGLLELCSWKALHKSSHSAPLPTALDSKQSEDRSIILISRASQSLDHDKNPLNISWMDGWWWEFGK